MSDIDRQIFSDFMAIYCKRYGTWAVLHAFTEAIRPACKAQAESEKPKPRPRKPKAPRDAA